MFKMSATGVNTNTQGQLHYQSANAPIRAKHAALSQLIDVMNSSLIHTLLNERPK